MGRPTKENRIKLNVAETMQVKKRQNIQIEHLKDCITKEKIKEFSKVKPICFNDLIKEGGSHSAQQWIDYWIQSGMFRNLFDITMPMNKGTECYGYYIDGVYDLLKKPRYAWIYLCKILKGLSDDDVFECYINRLFLGNTQIEDDDKKWIEMIFAREQEILDEYWVLFEKAAIAWEKNLAEINYSTKELNEFTYLLQHYGEDHFKKNSEDIGYFSDEDEDLQSSENELVEDGGMLQKEFEEWDNFEGLDQLEETDISEESFTEEKISFERFSDIIAILFSRGDKEWMESDHHKSNETNGFLGTRSVIFPPFLGAFLIGLNKCYKTFPFNPELTIIKEGADKQKRMRCPRACIELMTILRNKGRKVDCPELCIKLMENQGDVNKTTKSKNGTKGKRQSFREEYILFCIKFFKIIINGNQMYQVNSEVVPCNSYNGKPNNRLYKKCIIYIFEEVFAYCLFKIEAKTTILELIEHAVKRISKEDEEGSNDLDIEKLKEEAESLYFMIRLKGACSGLLQDIYRCGDVHIRAQRAPMAIKKWMDENIDDEVYYLKCIENEMEGFNCDFIGNIEQSLTGKQYQKSFDEYILFDFESEIDRSYVEFEKLVLSITKKNKEKDEYEIHMKDEMWNDFNEEIYDAIQQVDTRIGKAQDEREWFMRLYDDVFRWVVKASLDLEEIEIRG